MTTSEWLRAKIGPSPNPPMPGQVRRSDVPEIDFFTSYLAPDMNLLHALCGDGRVTLPLGIFVSRGAVTGIDTDPASLRRARSRSVPQAAGDVSFERVSLADLPFGAEEFDAVLLDGIFLTGESPERALEEAKRVLVPGGLLGVRHTVESSRVMTGQHPLLERALRRRETVTRDLGGDPDGGLEQPALLRDAGFVNLRVTSSTQQATADDLLDELSAGGFVPQDPSEEEQDSESMIYCFVTAVETVCWKTA